MTKTNLPTMDNFSIDLETLGTRCDAPILSIGVAQFDINTGKIGGTWYKEIQMDSALKYGRPSAATLSWWLHQNSDARGLFKDKPEKMHIASALAELTTWLRGKSFAPIVWGNGATFDISILEYAYDHACVGTKEPWHYYNIRDMSTLVEAARMDKTALPFKGVVHNALDDATYQAAVISACWQKISKALGAPAVSPAPAPAAAIEDDEL